MKNSLSARRGITGTSIALSLPPAVIEKLWHQLAWRQFQEGEHCLPYMEQVWDEHLPRPGMACERPALSLGETIWLLVNQGEGMSRPVSVYQGFDLLVCQQTSLVCMEGCLHVFSLCLFLSQGGAATTVPLSCMVRDLQNGRDIIPLSTN